MHGPRRHFLALVGFLVLCAQAADAVSGQTQPLAERAAELQAKIASLEQTEGKDSPPVASALNELAIFHFQQGNFTAAEPLLRRALAIREATLGGDHALTAQAAGNLAQVVQGRGMYADAEPLLERSLAIYEKARGAEHPDVARALNNLAGLYRLVGDYRRAEPLYQRALAMWEKLQGPDNPSVAAVANNLGLMYQQAGEAAKARPLLERSLAIREKAAEPNPRDIALALNNLAVFSQEQGDLARAQTLYDRAIALYESVHGRRHPLVGQALNNLAVVHLLKGEYDAAGKLYEEALEIRSATLGPTHPDMSRALTSQAIYFDVIGRIDDAVRRQREATEIAERNLTLTLASGSEAQKLRYMATFTEETDITVSMHRQSAPSNPAAVRLALTTVLRRKGRVLDAMSGSVGALRAQLSAEDLALLDRLSAERTRLAALVLRGPGPEGLDRFNADVQSLEESTHQLERLISARSAAFRSQTQDVSIDTVRSRLSPGAALVEIVLYRPFDNKVAYVDKRFGPARYAAYVLKLEGEPASVDLGAAAAIDSQVEQLRRALRDPKSPELKGAASKLFATVIEPLLSALGTTERLLISPDGALNLVPFATLIDQSGKYVLETHDVSYLTSGRDLLRFQVRADRSTPPLVVANPDFGEHSVASTPTDATRALDLSRVRFTPLPGTGAEADALRLLLPAADIRTGADATEAAVKSARGPLLLHLATHGFFLDDAAPALTPATTGTSRLLLHEGPSSRRPELENPLLRSGLAFAGANRRDRSTPDDGILTAMEASSLDLWGTRMAVLSACETGVGEARRGDGVYGLRRALVIAGVESQVMTLWQVSDTATRDLMEGFYTRLKDGLARSQALREVQLGMLRTSARSHPYYWGSFILSGADGPIAVSASAR
jgi:CHAT domain-containing protein/tetratricopeptide (TPR) repeat protein